METITRIVLAVCFVGAVAVVTLVSAHAQYYPPPPGYGYGPPPPGYDYGPDPNGCPPGYSLQGGNCAPYRGPTGGGWRTYNGCPPGYTIQGGNCAPYQGHGYYRY
jgi:hypothetical protein